MFASFLFGETFLKAEEKGSEGFIVLVVVLIPLHRLEGEVMLDMAVRSAAFILWERWYCLVSSGAWT